MSRIYLDNLDHITAYWVSLVPQSGMTQVAWSDGADDLHGTIIESHKAGIHMAGATSPQLQTEAEMIKAILPSWRDDRTSVQRNTFYEPILVLENAPAAIPQGGTELSVGKSKVLKDNLATT